MGTRRPWVGGDRRVDAASCRDRCIGDPLLWEWAPAAQGAAAIVVIDAAHASSTQCRDR
jgi:hypothetical protein